MVEDDAEIRASVCELLANEGYHAVGAENGAVALEQLALMLPLPSLILLDLMMPVKDGFQFRAEQRRDGRLAHIPVVVMSADPNLRSRHDILDARSYIRKPFDISDLIAIVSSIARDATSGA